MITYFLHGDLTLHLVLPHRSTSGRTVSPFGCDPFLSPMLLSTLKSTTLSGDNGDDK